MTPLCTIGYEGYSAEEWLESLAANRVEIVVDVREMPLSRKPGFSKTRLAEMLRSKGIDYVHLRALGNPKAYRDRLRNGWDFVEFADEYRRILDAQPEALDALLALATHRRICLVCFEEDPAACHRSIVAEYVSESQPELRVSHLRYA
jgi:uncharacterized protein (DUF488 family)